MNVVIIEDESLSARRLEKMLLEYDAEIRVLAQIPSVAKAIQYFDEHSDVDLVFMDIHLEDDNAFRILEKYPLSIPVIFTTAYDQYMLKAFKLNSVDYLLKPIDADELHAAIDKFKKVHYLKKDAPATSLDTLIQLFQTHSEPYKERFMVTIGTRIISVPTEEIAYFYYKEKSVWIMNTDGQSMAVEYSLDKLGQLTDPKKFFRANRAFLISHRAIRSIHSYSGSKLKVDLEPSPKQDIFVSLDRLADFKEWLGK